MTGPDPAAASTFLHRPGDPWEVSRQVPVGEVLHIELHPAGGYRWSALESSDPEVVAVVGTVGADGVARFDATARRTGSAVLAATTQFQGDRFGPPTRRWTMTVRSMIRNQDSDQ